MASNSAEIFYHASHEQFPPSELLQLAKMAELAGFDGVHCSDHFHPWSERQGQSGFSFSWVAAAMQATNLPFSMICAPGQRYHPAIAAQAMATLCELFPGRINFELGSGEALNEVITGDGWPDKQTRNRRLLDCVEIIRKLLNGEEVSHNGLVRVEKAKLYTLPATLPLLLCAAITSETAGWAGSWADGLLTTAEKTKEKNLTKMNAFYKGGGEGKPVYLQYAFSFARDRSVAEEEAFDQWRSNILPKEKLATMRTVADFDKAGQQTSKDEVLNAIPVFTDIRSLMDSISILQQTGADRIILHNVSRQQRQFIEDFQRYQ
jgi:coenzyme F420-dependent glucose-6-phosphate dehydrogenase